MSGKQQALLVELRDLMRLDWTSRLEAGLHAGKHEAQLPPCLYTTAAFQSATCSWIV